MRFTNVLYRRVLQNVHANERADVHTARAERRTRLAERAATCRGFPTRGRTTYSSRWRCSRNWRSTSDQRQRYRPPGVVTAGVSIPRCTQRSTALVVTPSRRATSPVVISGSSGTATHAMCEDRAFGSLGESGSNNHNSENGYNREKCSISCCHGAPAEHRWTPGERLPDGCWAPGTLVRTPTGDRVKVLPYAT